MKKLIILLVVATVAVSSLFAVNNIINVSVSPWGTHLVSTDWGTSHSSDYGWGATVGYKRHVDKFLLGGEISYFGFKDTGATLPVTINMGRIMAKVGGKIVVSPKVDINIDFGAGFEIAKSNTTSYLFVLGSNASTSLYVSSNVAITFGADFAFTWVRTKGTSYKASIWTINPALGVEIDF